MKNTLLESIGNTPVVLLQHINTTACEIYVKLECHNPGGSIKDRIAKHMIEKALGEGALQRDGIIVEPTSGNTGIALAMIAATLGIRCVIVMPESMSLERRKLMQGYGAELILTPAHEGMSGAVLMAEEVLAQTKNAFMPSQFTNPHAVHAHYENTGPEILAELGQHIDALVAGVGTGSTLMGCGMYLREKIPAIRLVAVEPEESPLLSQEKSGSHGIQGIGANFIPSILRPELISEILTVHTEAAIETSRLLQKKEGISCGISSGANVSAALKLAAQPCMKGKRIVTFVCDSAERYMSTALFA